MKYSPITLTFEPRYDISHITRINTSRLFLVFIIIIPAYGNA